jgi:hypothetical protein
MTIEKHPGWGRAQCDRCALTTPKMEAANDETLCAILTTAGWSVIESKFVYCPICRSFSAAAYVRKYAPPGTL